MAKRDISIKTADGVAQAALFGSGTNGVIVYMDAFGPRPAMDEICERIASNGYTVLLPDLFYRFGVYGPFDAKTAFTDPVEKSKIMAMITGTSQSASQADTSYFLDALSAAGATGTVGTVGYCMGGSRAINAAAKYPDRIKAAASFHGGNLAADNPESPANQASTIKGRVYVGTAGVDGSFPPEQSAKLAQAFRVAEVDHIIENYVGMVHGWTVSDHAVFDKAGAARHWNRLTTLYAETLEG